jgi:hypothetical protein
MLAFSLERTGKILRRSHFQAETLESIGSMDGTHSDNTDGSHSNNMDGAHSNNMDGSHSDNMDGAHSKDLRQTNSTFCRLLMGGAHSDNMDGSHSDNMGGSHSDNMDGSHSDNMDSSHSDDTQSSSSDGSSSNKSAKESSVKLPSYTELKARVQHYKDLQVIAKLGRKVTKMQGQQAKLVKQMAEQKEALDLLEWQTTVQNKLLSSRHRALIRQGPSTRPPRHRGHLARSDTKHPGKFAEAKKAMSTRQSSK